MPETLKFIDVGRGTDARRIAVRALAAPDGAAPGGASPGLFWLGGFKSDMKGTKAEALARFAADKGRGCVRFDYSGHGESQGDFAAGTIGRWLEESLAVFTGFCRGPQVVIGSSMGGWLALLLARELARRTPPGPGLSAIVLVAPAVDFTEELMWKKFTPTARRELETSPASSLTDSAEVLKTSSDGSPKPGVTETRAEP